MDDMHPITLSCCRCGKQQHGMVSDLPQFAFELVEIAKKAGFVGAYDMGYGRALVFCSDDCAEAAKTKRGHYPLRIKRVEAEDSVTAPLA